MNTYHVTISIVLYKPDNTTITNINSLLNTTLVHKLFLIDNSPNDQFRKLLPNNNNIEYIHLNKNVGFGSAHNIIWNMIKTATSYHLILNPDVEINTGVLEGLYTFMQNTPNATAVMPNVLYKNGQTQHLCKLIPTPLHLIFRRFIPKKLKYLIQSKIDKYELKHITFKQPTIVPIVSGCFLFLRVVDLIQTNKLFDERYFMYMEDIDLCRRISLNKSIYFHPNISIYHGYAKGSYKNFTLLKEHIISAIKYFNKWGWIFDKQRKQTNKSLLKYIQQQ